VSRGEVEQAGEVRQVRSPVAPASDERSERPEGPFAPDVDAAFLRIARRQLEHGEDERHEQAERGDDPDDQRAGPGRGGRRNPAQAEAGDQVEKEEVAEAEDASKLSHGFCARQRLSTDTNRVSTGGSSPASSGCSGSPGTSSMRTPSCTCTFGMRLTTRRARAQASAASTDENGSSSRSVVHVGGGSTISSP